MHGDQIFALANAFGWTIIIIVIWQLKTRAKAPRLGAVGLNPTSEV